MAKGSGNTRSSGSSNPKGLWSNQVKITVSFSGAKFAEGVTHSNYQVAKLATELYPGIVSGGGHDSIGFRKNTPDSTIQSYVKDVKALNKISDKYEAKMNSLPKGLSTQERIKQETAIMKESDAALKAYYEKRNKQLNK